MNKINNSKCEIIAKNIATTTINAMATIYNKDSYKVSVYPASAEGSHKENHVSVVVRKDDEAGNLAVCDGRVLNGNLTQKNINWCREVLLTEENKVRINQMIETNDYYRLDRPDEIANHPLSQNNEKKASICTEQQTSVKWEDTFVQDIKHLNYYKFLITFADGSVKTVDLNKELHRLPKLYKKLLENPQMLPKVKIEPKGTGIFWDDLIGFPCDWLYEIGY